MIFKRQKVLLYILLEIKKTISVERFNLIVAYISCKGPISSSEMYSFLPNDNGLQSILLKHEIKRLEKNNLVTQGNGEKINISDTKESLKIIYSLSFKEQNSIRTLIEEISLTSDDQLLKKILKCCPEFGNISKRKNIGSIVTAGYEGDTIDGFLRRLLSGGIKTIIDIRKNPISRKHGFSKNTMKQSAQSVGIEYVHFPELGIPSNLRKNLKSKDDYRKLFDEYEKTVLKETVEYQEEILKLIRKQASVLVCFEKDPSDCHRGRLATHLARTTKLKISHL